MTKECFLSCFLIGLVVNLVQGQQPSSPSQSQRYVIPSAGIIHEYKRQLEDDLYAVERKAELVAQRECISGKESFYFCSLDLNILDFVVCIFNPAATAGSDAFIRGVKFPSSAFGYTPNVAVGIGGIGTVVFGDVKVVAKEVYSSGFNIVISGGLPAYPYSLTVVWVACPANYPVSPSVREFIPKAVPPPPPYFPINPAGGNQSPTSNTEKSVSEEKQSTNNENQSLNEDKQSEYEESSKSVDDESLVNPAPYVQKPERYGQTTPSNDKDAKRTPPITVPRP